MTIRAYLMSFGAVLFLVLIGLAWWDVDFKAFKNLFIIPILCSLIYATQILSEEKKLSGKWLGNLAGIVVSLVSVAMMLKFL